MKMKICRISCLNAAQCFVDASKGTAVSGSRVISWQPVKVVEPLLATAVLETVDVNGVIKHRST